MSRPGRKPVPTPLKIAQGNPGKRSINHDEPKPDPSLPSMPEWISDEAKAVWFDVAPRLHQMGVLTTIDRDAFTRYCVAFSRWKTAEIFLKKNGEVYPVKDSKGNIRKLCRFPQVDIALSMSGVLARLEAEFGMTPSARSFIKVEQGEDEFEKFLRNRGD